MATQQENGGETKEADADAEDLIDRSKYLGWEPENLKEKMFSYWQNTVELQYVITVGITAMFLSSMVAIGYFLISYLLLFSMLLNMEKRIWWGYFIMAFKAFIMLSCVIWKLRKIDTMVMTCNINNPDDPPPGALGSDCFSSFKREIRFYESLGFDLNYHSDELVRDNVPLNGEYSYTYNMTMSFFFEGIMIAMMVSFISYIG